MPLGIRRYKDLTNIKFGKLKPINPTNKLTKGYVIWNCLCDCGKHTLASSHDLKRGHKKSCGCLLTEGNNRKYPKGMGGILALYSKMKYAAKKRKIEFSLSFNEVSEITKKNCFYCGVQPNQCNKRQGMNQKANKKCSVIDTYIYNGIDRLDSSKGYYLENIVPCCKRCNWAKGDLSIEEFYLWVKKVNDRVVKYD